MRKRLVLLATMAVLLVLTGTGTAVWASHLTARGGFTEPTHVQFRTKTTQGTQVINVRDASDVAVQHFGPFAAETVGPWHTHPGPALVVVTAGQFTYQHADCSTDVYGPGEVALDPGQGYVHRGIFAPNTEVTAVFFGVPHGLGHTDPNVTPPVCD